MCFKEANISETDLIFEIVMYIHVNQLTQLSAQDFIKFICQEYFMSSIYIYIIISLMLNYVTLAV